MDADTATIADYLDQSSPHYSAVEDFLALSLSDPDSDAPPGEEGDGSYVSALFASPADSVFASDDNSRASLHTLVNAGSDLGYIAQTHFVGSTPAVLADSTDFAWPVGSEAVVEPSGGNGPLMAPTVISVSISSAPFVGLLDRAAIVDAAIGPGGATPAQLQQALNAVGLSFTGAGIRVGVLSDSFNNLGGAAADEANGALPATVTVLEDLASGGTDEGRAMLQIVHDIAPGASLYFYTAFQSEQDFANGILALAASGCKVICDDVSYFDEPFFQNGIVAQAIQTVEQEGVVYVTAAGNEASNAYQAAWTPIASTTYHGVTLHDTENFGGSPVQTITVGGTSSYSVPLLLEWNQPYGVVTSNLEILVFHNGRLIGTATNSSLGEPNNPWTEIELRGGSTYQIAIENLSGPDPGLIKEIAAGNGIPVTISGADVGTVFGHAMSPYAITVGAVSTAATPAFGVNPPVSEYFSSSGAGTELLFDNNGNALPSPDLLNPVAVSGVDNISTTVSGSLSDFYGTSAATPGAAAVAALMLQANGVLSPTDIENLLEDSAISMSGSTTSNYNAIAGYGLIQANLAVQYAVTNIITLDANHGVIAGTHLADTFMGGLGNHTINGDGGADTLDYADAPGAVTVDLSSGTTGTGGNGFGGTDIFMGIVNVIGSPSNDVLISSPTLDSLIGGGGNDVFVVYDSNDTVSQSNGGTGIVAARADYVLPQNANVNALVLQDAATHGTGNDQGDLLVANDTLASTLTGGLGNDYLVGGQHTTAGGHDILIGGGGNDTFVVYNSADQVSQTAGPGNSGVVIAHVDYALPQNVNVNILVLSDTASHGTGNDQGDILVANDLVASTLTGGSGNDTLVGGQHSLGHDSLIGGGGNDVFVVYDSNDTISQSNGGTGYVSAHANYTLPDDPNIKTLVLFDSATQGTGNNYGDTLVANDSIASTLTGGSGNDLLVGGQHSAGHDSLIGGGGNDTFVVYDSNDTVSQSNGGTGTVLATVDYALAQNSNVNTLFLIGSASHGTANDQGDILYANDSVASTLTGGLGNDVMVGGSASDLFVFAPQFGADIINHFQTTGANHDVIQLDTSVFANWSALQPHIQDDANGNAVIAAPAGNSITLLGVHTADLNQNDFQFHTAV